MSELGDSLLRAAVAMRSEPVERTAELARMIVSPRRSVGARIWGRGRAVAPAAAIVLLLAVTPPGRSAVSWAADLVGIGGEPTKELPLELSTREAVIGFGEAPNGTRYEVVASTQVPSVGGSTRRVTCIRLDLPDVKEIRSLQCATDELNGALAEQQILPSATLSSESLGEQGLVIQGAAATDAARVEVVHESDSGETTTYPAQVFRLEPPVTDQIEAPAPVNYLLAFIPSSLVPPRTASTQSVPLPGEHPPSHPPPIPNDSSSPAQQALRQISVIAYDAASNEIGRERLDGSWAALNLYPPTYPSGGTERASGDGQ